MTIYDSLMRLCNQIGCSFDVAYLISLYFFVGLSNLLFALLVKAFNAFHEKVDK